LKYLVYILLFCFSTLKAQNLITNPSFEDIDSCYGQFANIGFDVFKWSGCKGWSNPIKSSSDLWCQNPIVGNTIAPNIIGYQYPRTGSNMAAILVEPQSQIQSYREFVQNELLTSLVSNRLYILSFYYVVASGKSSGNCPPNQFGVFGSKSEFKDSTKYFLSNLTPLGVSKTESFIDDTLNWSKCEIVFNANGDERFLIIGNFQDSSTTTFNFPCDTSFWGGLNMSNDYFYLDDFSLDEFFDFSVPNVFTPNKDGVNDYFFPEVIQIDDWEMVILNRWGNTIVTLDKNNPTWTGDHYSDGVYFYTFKSESKEILKQGYFQLIR
jgi:gliding motility-associated-like protein